MTAIAWLDDLKEAQEESRRSGLPILADFFMPECIGCHFMAQRTYPAEGVADYIGRHLVPLHLDPDGPESERYFVRWTPWLVFLDADANPHHTIVGFTPPEEFIPALILGRAKVRMAQRDWEGVMKSLDGLLERHPKSQAAPEAVFLRGIARKRATGESRHLKEAWQTLTTYYPASKWAGTSWPYQHLEV